MYRWYIFGAYTTFIVLVLIGAYIGVIPTEIGLIPMYDLIGHFILYGIWFFLLHKALKEKTIQLVNVDLPIAFLVLLPIIALEEFAQALASTRTFSLIDLLWGLLGISVFWFISNKYSRVSDL
jgi:hypothetical protein